MSIVIVDIFVSAEMPASSFHLYFMTSVIPFVEFFIRVQKHVLLHNKQA